MNLSSLLIAPVLLALTGIGGCTALSKMSQVIMDPSIPVGEPNNVPTEIAFSINVSPTLNGNPNSLEVSTVPQGALEPTPYAVSLSANDPHALIEKVGAMFAFLQEQFPAMSPVVLVENDEQNLPRSPVEESTPGSYDDSSVVLTLPRDTAITGEHIATPIAIKILQLRDDTLLNNSVYQLLQQDPTKVLRSTYIRDDDYLLQPGQFKFVPFEPVHAETRFIAVIGDYRNQENTTWRQVLRIPPRGRQIILSVLLNDTQIVLKGED